MTETLTRTEASDRAPNWRYLLGRMHLNVDLPSFTDAVDFVGQVADIAERLNHHPEIDIRYKRVHVAISSHDAGGITELDIEFCGEVDEAAEAASATAAVDELTEVEIAIDTMDVEVIRPFWKAVLGYDDEGDESLIDPNRVGPGVWFQQLDEARPVRNRIHLDVTVAHDQAQARIDAALAAGGVLVSDDAAPSFWVLADAEGNEACICTWQGRDEWDARTAADASAPGEAGGSTAVPSGGSTPEGGDQ